MTKKIPTRHERAPSTTKVLLCHSVRSSRGGLLVVMMVFILVLVISLVPVALVTAQSALMWRREQSALEAAALAAAKDLEKIIVNDPHFGYIALSDYPPCGKATIAGDGEPLPVLSINTVIGTARLETIIANDLGNPELITLAQEDTAAARNAAKLLQDKLISAIQPNNNYPATDLEGNIVTPYEHARQTYLANCPTATGSIAPRCQDFRLSLGWLNDGSSTVTPIPQPFNSAEVPEKAKVKDRYKAFIDIPAGGESFY